MGIANERLKGIRKSLGMTQEKFAEKIDVTAANLRKLEKDANITISNAIKISEEFGYSLDYIYGLTDSTNDEASTMLLYLRKLFHYEYDAKSPYPHTVKVPQPVIDFLKQLATADDLLASGTLPPNAYDIWVNQLKVDFNKAMGDFPAYEKSKATVYKMVSARNLVMSDPKPSQLR